MVEEEPKEKILEPASDEEKPHKKDNSSDKALIISSIVILLLMAAFFIVPRFVTQKDNDLTLDELHKKNLEGKLPTEKGYLYNGVFSFVKFDDLWYTRLATASGKQIYDMPFHFGPRELESVPIEGNLSYEKLDSNSYFYVTFDPSDTNLQYVALSIGEADAILINAFSKGVIPACTKNETAACASVPIISCNSTKVPVFFFDSAPKTGVTYDDNCIIVSGEGENLVKATDKMLFDLLQIV